MLLVNLVALLVSLLFATALTAPALAGMPAAPRQALDPTLCPRMVPATGGGPGEELITATSDQMADDAVMVKLRLGKGRIDGAALSPTGQLIATAMTDRQGSHRVQLWDASTGRKLAETTIQGPLVDLTLAADGRTLAGRQVVDESSSALDTLVMRYDAASKQLSIEHTIESSGVPSLHTLSPDGSTLAIAASGVELWDTASGKLQQTLAGEYVDVPIEGDSSGYMVSYVVGGHVASIQGLSFNADGSRLLTSGDAHDGTVRIWDTETGAHLGCLEAFTVDGIYPELHIPRFDQDDEQVVALDSSGERLYRWDVAAKTLIETIDTTRRTRFETRETPMFFDLSPDRSELLIASPRDEWVKVLDTTNGNILRMVTVPGLPLVVQFGPEGDTLLTAFSSAAVPVPSVYGDVNADAPAATRADRGVWLWDLEEPSVADAGERQNVLAQGVELLLTGEIEQARTRLRRAQSLGATSQLEFSRDLHAVVTAASKRYVTELMDEARVEEAITIANNASNYVGVDGKDFGWQIICRRGPLYGVPDAVLDACNRAVALDPGSGEAADARGIARAIAGDGDGAIADFEEVVARWQDDVTHEFYLGERIRWLEALYDGADPFDRETLQRLRTEFLISWPAVAVGGGALDLRAAPDVNAGVIGQTVPGAVIRITGRSADGAWLRAKLSGIEGWVEAQRADIDQSADDLPVVSE